ncbi:MAG: PAS domain S-box protein [Magnetospirillum sp. WYHS-4]
MDTRRIFGLAILAFLTVVILATTWEFWLEPMFGPVMFGSGPGLVSQQWEFVIFSVLVAGLALGITALVAIQAEQREAAGRRALAESEQRYRSLVEMSPTAIVVHKRGVIAYANQAAATLLGARTPEDLVNIGVLCLVHPQDQKQVAGRLKVLWEGASGLPAADLHMVRLDGDEIDVSAATTSTTLYGEPAQQTVMSDITEAKRSAELLRTVAEGLSGKVGESFFHSLVAYLAETLEVEYAFVGELIDELPPSIRTIAVQGGRTPRPNFQYRLDGTPCNEVVGKKTCVFPKGVKDDFPQDRVLVQMGVESYVGTPLFDSSGRPLGILVVLDTKPIADSELAVSLLQIFAVRAAAELERNRSEEAIRANEERFRAVADSANDAIISADHAGRVVFWNRAAERLFGHGLDEMIGQPLDAIIPERYREAHARGMARASADGSGTLIGGTAELYGRRKDGGEFPVELSLSTWSTRGERYFTAIIRDISERRRTEDRLRQLSRAVEQSPVSVVITDTQGTIQYVNPKFTEVSGYSEDEALGNNPRILKSGETSPDDYLAMWDALRAGETWRGEFHNRRKSGELYWESASISPIRAADGTVTHFIAVKEDISERKQTERALHQAKEQAEFANRAKTEFLANMSHELRTPLNSIIGFSDLVMSEVFGPVGAPQYREYVRDINDSGKHLLDLINDLLDIARIETGELRLHERPVDVLQVVGTCRRLIEERARNASLTLTVVTPSGLPGLNADERKVKQILINLLGNAVKFTPEGGNIALSARLDEEGAIVFAVEDTGIGIATGDIATALSPFGQVDGTLARKYEGAGLGLPLSKNLAELHGGSLVLESAPGIGTRVTVRFPPERTIRPS